MKNASVKQADHLPIGEHWAILEFRDIVVPGDQRSREAPGHGYPEHTERVVNYRAFTNEAEFTRELTEAVRLDHNRARFVGLHVDQVVRAVTKLV